MSFTREKKIFKDNEELLTQFRSKALAELRRYIEKKSKELNELEEKIAAFEEEMLEKFNFSSIKVTRLKLKAFSEGKVNFELSGSARFAYNIKKINFDEKEYIDKKNAEQTEYGQKYQTLLAYKKELEQSIAVAKQVVDEKNTKIHKSSLTKTS